MCFPIRGILSISTWQIGAFFKIVKRTVFLYCKFFITAALFIDFTKHSRFFKMQLLLSLVCFQTADSNGHMVLDLIMCSVSQVLLLDEPTSALDPISTENIEDVLVNLKKKQGMTIIMVSHSIKQIQRIADIVCLLVKGEIVEVLRPDKLSEAKHLMALRFLQLSS